MDWLFHILFGLLISNQHFSLFWLLFGSILPDFCFVASFLMACGFSKSRISAELVEEKKVRRLFVHKLGYVLHGLPCALVCLSGAILISGALQSLFVGLLSHQILDFCTHKERPNPMLYPFTSRRIQIGIVGWSVKKKCLYTVGLLILLCLLLIKKLTFGFIF